jgi:hypothetical protein
MLRKSPGFAAVAILTLALAIGANTAIFTLVNAVMLQSLPVRNPSELYRLGQFQMLRDVWPGGALHTFLEGALRSAP